MGYNSPLSGLESRTFNARLALPSLWRSAASFTLDGLVDTVREGVFCCGIGSEEGGGNMRYLSRECGSN